MLAAAFVCCSVVAPSNFGEKFVFSDCSITASAVGYGDSFVTATSGRVVRDSPNGNRIGSAQYGVKRTGWVCLTYIASHKVNTPSGVCLRTGAGTNFGKITTIPNGKYVYVFNNSSVWSGGRQWYKVSYNGNIGYVCAEYLTRALNNGWGY